MTAAPGDGWHELGREAQGLAHSNPRRAIALLRNALQQAPEEPKLWALLAVVEDSIGQREAAASHCLRVLAAPATEPLATFSAATQLLRYTPSAATLTLALDAFRALGEPLELAGELLQGARSQADWRVAAPLERALANAYRAGDFSGPRESPRAHLLWCADEAINHRVLAAWSQQHLAAAPPASALPPLPAGGRRLRVGYLSSTFREHPNARLVKGLLRHHDREQFEVLAFCSGWDDGSALRADILQRCDQVHLLTALDDSAAAALIRACKVDVLVDLNGPTRGNRMGILAQRAAPVQISYLEFPGSVGGRVVDYIVGDACTVPEGSEALYAEHVIRLAPSYQVNDHAAGHLGEPPSREVLGLPAEGPVAGMFNAVNKVSPVMWSLWMAILRAAPAASLCLLDPGAAARTKLQGAAQAQGVTAQRLLFLPRVGQEEHLARLQACDVMLDPWPYGGHTSTTDALYAGVPVVALAGSNFASRVSGSLLQASGLGELVAADPQAYARIACAVLQQPELAGKLREHLCQLRPRNPLFNTAARARQLEAAYRAAFDLAQRGEPPQHITVAAREPAAGPGAAADPYHRG